MSPHTLNIGFLLFARYQWLDGAGPIDYLNNHSRARLIEITVPEDLLNKAPIIVWHYISSDLTPIQATSGPPQTPTCTYVNCPPLDYLLVPGHGPSTPLSEGCAAFLKERVPRLKALLTVCTGSLAIAQTGLLDGLHVCSNKIALRRLAEAGTLNRNVKWVGDRRWIVDRKVWSSAGITAGIDLAVEFAKVHFDPEVVEFAKLVAEYKARPDRPDPFSGILEGIDLNGSE